MKASNGVRIEILRKNVSAIVRLVEPPENIIPEVDKYLAEHPKVQVVYIIVEGLWDNFHILQTHDLPDEDLRYIDLMAEMSPKEQAADLISGFLNLRGR